MLHARTRIRTANSAVTIDTVCSRQCSLKMSASEEAAPNIDQTSSKKTPKQKARRWSDEETDRLIDLLEGNRCLWDVFCADYHLKDKRERAYSSIEEELNISVSDIRNKIVGLRSQLARELAKTNSKKSGQGRHECYKSTWIYWERLQFLKLVMKAGKSRDSLDQQSSSLDIEVDSVDDDLNEDNEENISPQQKVHRKGFKRKLDQDLAAKKHQVLETCLQVLKEPVQRDDEKKPCYFAMYVAEKLETFDKRKRMLAENRIQNLLFELEIEEEHSSQDPSVTRHSQTSTHNRNQGSISYMRMLQSHSPPQFHRL